VTIARHTFFMVIRQARNLQREPIWIALLLIQPMIWLLLYGQLFSRVPALRGGASSYVEFLTPGVVCMNAFFGGSWSGMAMINDLDRHVVDRFLASPASRISIVLSQIVRQGIVAIIQALIILIVALALGVRVHGGAAGWLVVLAAAALLSMVFAGWSNGVALLVRKEATMIATSNFFSLPLMFLSSILIGTTTMPHWMQQVSRYNPVDWGVRSARDAVLYGGHWGSIGAHLGLLVGAVALTTAFATWTFRAYQRSL
jgi:ABC-2 type transport system permease protein